MIPAACEAALVQAMDVRATAPAYPDARVLNAARIDAASKRVVLISNENSYLLRDDLSLVQSFYSLGVRIVGPVQMSNKELMGSSTKPDGPEWPGPSCGI